MESQNSFDLHFVFKWVWPYRFMYLNVWPIENRLSGGVGVVLLEEVCHRGGRLLESFFLAA